MAFQTKQAPREELKAALDRVEDSASAIQEAHQAAFAARKELRSLRDEVGAMRQRLDHMEEMMRRRYAEDVAAGVCEALATLARAQAEKGL